jgi:hypothetical protein
MHAENEHPEFRPQAFQVSKDVETAAAWHGDVQNYKIPMLRPNLGKNLVRAFSLATDHVLKITHKYFFESCPQDCMIVCDENFTHWASACLTPP